MIGEQVILSGRGGVEEIGTVIPSETGHTRGVWVLSPTKGYASDYALHNVKKVTPLPVDQQEMLVYLKEILHTPKKINKA